MQRGMVRLSVSCITYRIAYISMSNIQEDILKILKSVANGPIHEEEYAGRMEDYCMYCGKWQDPKKPEEHNDDCISMLARKVLTGIKERKQTTGRIEDYDDVMMKR